MKQHFKIRLAVLMAAVLILTVIGLVFELAWSPRLAQAGTTLPSREPPPTPAPKKDHNRPVGAYIELSLQPAQVGAWTVVQWQDSVGNWHDVTGWQGPPQNLGRRWWVEAKDFGTGPFRWAVTSGPDQSPGLISQPFKLPASANETVWIVVGQP